jgi:hypothetical protein
MPITVMLMLTLDGEPQTRWAADLIGRRGSATPAREMPDDADEHRSSQTADGGASRQERMGGR